MGFIIPFEDTDLAFRTRMREEAILMLSRLVESVGKRPEDYIVRNIFPSLDLDFANDQWVISFTAPNAWEAKIDISVPENKFIVFYGYQNNSANPLTIALRFRKGTDVLEYVHVDNIYTYRYPIGFFAALGWKENEPLTIDFMGRAAGTDNPILLGLVAERVNVRVSRPLLSELVVDIQRARPRR
jgi:hypothetical protein